MAAVCEICGNLGSPMGDGACDRCPSINNFFYTSKDSADGASWSVYSEKERQLEGGEILTIDGTQEHVVSLPSQDEAQTLATKFYNLYKDAEGSPWLE